METVMYEAKGKIHYSPVRRGHHWPTNWWMILELQTRDLGFYYRYLYWINANKCSKLIRSTWNEHVTLVRGASEKPLDELRHLWGKYEGKEYKFYYENKVLTNGEYFWLPVHFPMAGNIREELGIRKEPRVPFHLTIGHLEGIVETEE